MLWSLYGLALTSPFLSVVIPLIHAYLLPHAGAVQKSLQVSPSQSRNVAETHSPRRSTPGPVYPTSYSVKTPQGCQPQLEYL